MFSVGVACIGIGILLNKRHAETKARLMNIIQAPPLSWYGRATPRTQKSVSAAASTGFQQAQDLPAGQLREDALREYSFEIPHHVALLNETAIEFRLENMGSPNLTNDDWRLEDSEWYEKDASAPVDPSPYPARDNFLFDESRDVRIYFYFPDKAPTAQAVFIAVNFGLSTSRKETVSTVNHLHELWQRVMRKWTRDHPDIVQRMQTGDLPIIFNLQSCILGTIWSTDRKRFLFADSANAILDLRFDQEQTQPQ